MRGAPLISLSRGITDEPTAKAVRQVEDAVRGCARAGAVVVTGSRGGNAALASLLTALDQLGIITDRTTA